MLPWCLLSGKVKHQLRNLSAFWNYMANPKILFDEMHLSSNASILGDNVVTDGAATWFTYTYFSSVNNSWPYQSCTNNELFFISNSQDYCPGNSSMSACVGSSVLFQYVGNYEGGVTCVWNFGDGVSSGSVSPGNQTHIYSLPGTYTVSCKVTFPASATNPSQNCDYTFSRDVVIVGVSISTNGPTTFCQGNSVTLTSSATSNIQWKKDGVAFSTSQTVVATQSGVYSVTSTNFGGCTTSTASLTINVLANPSISLSSQNAQCVPVNSGSISGTVSGGTAPYEYSLDGSSWNAFSGSSFSINNLVAGTYSVYIRTSEGCTTGPQIISVGQTAGLTITDVHQNVACKGASTGIINITASGGALPYSYDWSHISGTNNVEDLSGIPAGTYNVVVTDLNGCTGSRSIVLSEPATLFSVGITTTYQPCNLGNDGILTANPSGGTAPYSSYSWSPVGGSSAIASGLSPGNYSVSVTDNNGCTKTSNLVLNANASCCGSSSSQILTSAGNLSGTYSSVQSLSFNAIIPSGTAVTFDALDLYIAPNVSITIEPNATLYVRNASNLHACGAPWQGIILDDPTAQIIVSDQSSIQDANIAIHASNDAIVEIYNSLLSNNGIGVFLHGGSFSNFISDGSSFSGSSTLLPNVGVSIENVSNISIGNSSMGLNYFDGFRNAIVSKSSNLTVQNCRIEAQLSLSIGILAVGKNGSTYQLNVGGSSSDACYFVNCGEGIHAEANIALNATYNEFDGSGNMTNYRTYGISNKNSMNADVTIEENLFTRLDYGVWLTNINYANVNVNNNLFNNFNSLPARQGERAITLWSTHSISGYPKSITGNAVKHYMQGVSLTNQEEASILSNSFEFDVMNPITTWYGVRVLGGVKNDIRLNWINRNLQYPDLGLSNKAWGISIEKSEDNQIAENDIYNMGSGVRFFSTSVLNTIRCNNLIYNVDNLVLDNAIIGDQGTVNAASDNYWFINPNTALSNTGDHGNILNLGGNPNPTPVFFVQSSTLGFNPDDGSGDCPYICPALCVRVDDNATSQGDCANANCTEPDCYQELIANIIHEFEQYADLPDEQAAEARDFAFQLLVQDSMLMHQGTILDADLRNFYYQTLEENPGLFNDIVNLLQNEDNIGAIIINSSITPDNLSESNLQLFNDIFLETWAEYNFELDATQISTLEFIAYQNPYSGGDAVYSARVMLGLDIADFSTNVYERRSGKVHEEQLWAEGLIVPNPNSGKMSYIYSSGLSDDAELQIFSSRGLLIKSYNLKSNSTSIEIDLSDQANGFYVYRVVEKGVIHPGNKIILQK
jgi:hypothetical protein